MRKHTAGTLAIACLMLVFSSVAKAAEPAISPSLFVWVTKAASINTKMICENIVCGRLKGSSFCMEFPNEGLNSNATFMLTIDHATALVAFDGDEGLVILDGDKSIGTFGLFSSLQCALVSIQLMLSTILEQLGTLNIVGILQAIINGIVSVISCLLF